VPAHHFYLSIDKARDPRCLNGYAVKPLGVAPEDDKD
jgi:hypothetical protein